MHDQEIDFAHPVCRFVAEARPEHIPEHVFDVARKCLLDALGAMIVGASSEAGQLAAHYSQSVAAKGFSSVFASGDRISSAYAGLANGVAANGTDIDDVGRFTWGHPGAVVVPAAIGVAQEQQSSGARLLTAIVVGYEIAFRSGRILNYGLDPQLLGARREYRACGSWGSPAVAAIAANLRGLTVEQSAHALGIAEYHAPEALMLRDTEAPAMVKHAIGPGIQTGDTAAGMAALGFTGVPSYLLSPKFSAWTRDIDEVYHIENSVSFKRYSCCSFAHASLEAAETLLNRLPNSLYEVTEILVSTFSDAVLLGTRVPETSTEAQFSIAWSLAVLFEDGMVHPRAMQTPRLQQASTRELASKVKLVEDPELTRLFLLSEAEEEGGREAAMVKVVLQNGTEISSEVVDNVLFPEPQTSTSVLEDKFRWVTEDVLSPARVSEIITLVQDISLADSVEPLVAACLGD